MNDQRAHDRLMETTTYKQQRMCDLKRRYPSKKNASATARKRGGTAGAYKCPLCRGWHIGHSDGRRAVGKL